MFRAFVLLLASAAATLKDCSSSSLGHITNLQMDPSAPASGQYAIVTMDYTLYAPVTGGTAKYEASFNGFPLTPTVNDLCTDVDCPLVSGPNHYQTAFQMGDGAIHGTLSATVTWNSPEAEILCWGFTVRI